MQALSVSNLSKHAWSHPSRRCCAIVCIEASRNRNTLLRRRLSHNRCSLIVQLPSQARQGCTSLLANCSMAGTKCQKVLKGAPKTNCSPKSCAPPVSPTVAPSVLTHTGNVLQVCPKTSYLQAWNTNNVLHVWPKAYDLHTCAHTYKMSV